MVWEASAVAQLVKSPFVTVASHSRTGISSPATPLLVQLSANTPEETIDDGSNT